MGCLLPAKFWRITGCTDIGQKLLIWRPTCQGFRICITCIGRKWTVWPEKIIFYWKRPKNPLFRGDTIQVMSLWRELEAKPVTSGQLLGHPWNVWDITLQMSYVEAWWHQNWVHSRPILCRGGGDADISENLCFFYKTVRSPKFTNWNFSGAGTHGFSTHSAFRISIWKVCKKNSCPSYSCPKSGEGGKTGSASKNRHRNEKKTRPQFSKERSQNE